MKVKIGSKVYDANDQPIMLILDDIDKANIKAMSKEAKFYCAFPEGTADIKSFMCIRSSSE